MKGENSPSTRPSSGRIPMASEIDNKRRAIVLSSGLGKNARVFNDDDVVHLLRTTIRLEGSQIAFAKRYGISRTLVNMILKGKRPVGCAAAEALGLRRVYVVSSQADHETSETPDKRSTITSDRVGRVQ
jgi:hypothetical protein